MKTTTLSKKTKYVVLAVIAVVIFAFGLYVIAQNQKTNKLKNFKTFEQYGKNLTLPLSSPPITRSSSSGCFESEKYYDKRYNGCSFGYSKTYTLDGDFRDNAVKIKAYLNANGYIFKSTNSEKVFDSYMSNNKLNSDLSNGTPLVTDFINKSEDIELR